MSFDTKRLEIEMEIEIIKIIFDGCHFENGGEKHEIKKAIRVAVMLRYGLYRL